MEAKAPSPQTTLLILLGASEWPWYPEFQNQSSKAFVNAVQGLRAYFLNRQLFGLPDMNFLDLFDSEKTVDELDIEINQFLSQRLIDMKKAGNPARDVLLYFVGHGGFVGHNSDFYLAIRRTRKENPHASGLQVIALAHTLKERARFLRRIVILDCCFAGAAYSAFQGGPNQLAIEKTKAAFQTVDKTIGFPTKGTTLLCSSSHESLSYLMPDGSSTMFTKTFLDALIQGKTSPQDRLTLRNVKETTTDLLMEIPDAPQPVMHSPDQSEGDVAEVPFFPNPRAQKEQHEGVVTLKSWILSNGLDLVESQIISALEDETELERLERQAWIISNRLDQSARELFGEVFWNFKEDKIEKAKDAFIRSSYNDPLNVSTKLMCALMLIKRKKYEKALNIFWEIFQDFSYRFDLIPEPLYKAFTEKIQNTEIDKKYPLEIRFGNDTEFYPHTFWCSPEGFLIGWKRERKLLYFIDQVDFAVSAFSWSGKCLLEYKKDFITKNNLLDITMVTSTYFILKDDKTYKCYSMATGDLVKDIDEEKYAYLFLPFKVGMRTTDLYHVTRFCNFDEAKVFRNINIKTSVYCESYISDPGGGNMIMEDGPGVEFGPTIEKYSGGLIRIEFTK